MPVNAAEQNVPHSPAADERIDPFGDERMITEDRFSGKGVCGHLFVCAVLNFC